MKKGIVLLGMVVFFYHCSSTQTVPAKEESELVVVEGSPTVISLGQNLYENNCGKCHTLYSPDSFTQEQWKHWVGVMKSNTKLTHDQADEVLSYLQSNAKDQ